MRTRIEVSIPSHILSTSNALQHYVHKALKQFVFNHGDTILPDVAAALSNPDNVRILITREQRNEMFKVPPGVTFVADGDWPEDARMFNPKDTPTKGWVTQYVLDVVNHETAHQRINTSQSISKLRQEMENADDETSDEVHALEQRLVKLEEMQRNLLRVLCETPETKKVLDELLGNEADGDNTMRQAELQEGLMARAYVQFMDEALLNHILLVMAWTQLPRDFTKCPCCGSYEPSASELVTSDPEFIRWVISDDVINAIRRTEWHF